MKSRRILGIKETESSFVWAPSDACLGEKALLSDTSNQSSLFSSSPNFILLDNSTDESSPPANSYGVPHHVSSQFNPLMLILLVVMVSAFYSLGFCSFLAHLCGCRYTGRNSRRVGGNGRMNGASRGLDKSIIETFPVFKYSLVKGLKQGKEALECAVCLGEFEDDEALRLLPRCCHAFHPDCIDMWLFSHATCPLCRSKVVPEANIAEQGMRVNVERQPQQGQSHAAEQVVIVVEVQDRVDHHDGDTNGMNPLNTGLPRTSVDRSSVTDSPIDGIINGPRPVEKRSQNFRRSHSTGHSLVRLGGNPERPSEFYMSTDDRYVLDFAEGLMESSATGLHRSSSYAAFCHSGLEAAGIVNSEAFVNDRERLWRYPSSTEISEERYH